MKLKFLAAALLLGGMASASAGATVLDFENVPGLSSRGDFGSLRNYSYGGFDWSSSSNSVYASGVSEAQSWLMGHSASSNWNITDAAQGDYFAFMGQRGDSVSFSSIDGTPFNMTSGYFVSAQDGSSNSLDWTAIVNGTTVTGSSMLSASGSTLSFNLTNVSSFTFTSMSRVGFDNLNLNVGAVPEPTSAALTGLGIAVLALKRRRAQRKVAA